MRLGAARALRAVPTLPRPFHVTLFRAGQLTEIHFFEAGELVEAKLSALSALKSGAADSFEVIEEESGQGAGPALLSSRD